MVDDGELRVHKMLLWNSVCSDFAFRFGTQIERWMECVLCTDDGFGFISDTRSTYIT